MRAAAKTDAYAELRAAEPHFVVVDQLKLILTTEHVIVE